MVFIVVQILAITFHTSTAVAGTSRIFGACVFFCAVARVCIRTLVTNTNFGWYFVLARGCMIRIVVTVRIRILFVIFVTIYRRHHCPIAWRISFVRGKRTHFDANDDKRSQHNPIDINGHIPYTELATRFPNTPKPVLTYCVQSFLEKTNHQRKHARLSHSTKEVVSVTTTSPVDAVGQEEKGDKHEGHRNDKVPHLVLVVKAHGFKNKSRQYYSLKVPSSSVCEISNRRIDGCDVVLGVAFVMCELGRSYYPEVSIVEVLAFENRSDRRERIASLGLYLWRDANRWKKKIKMGE